MTAGAVSARRAAVLGAGGHAKVVIATLRAAGWEVAAAYDDAEGRSGREVLGVPIRGPLERVTEAGQEAVVIAIGDNRGRREVAARFSGERALPWIAVVHPAASVHPSVALGEGTVVFAGAVIQPDTVIGRHAIVNTGASVDHDCRLGDFVHVAPGVRIAGGVTVAEGAFLGIGSVVIPGLAVGAWSTVGAGSAAVRPVEPGVTVVGVPARAVRRTEP